VSDSAATGLIIRELSLSYDDDLVNIPGTIGFAVAYGFIRPFVFEKNRALAALIDGIHVAAVPSKREGAAVQVSYTVRF
jgi:hypothetical protein